MTLYALPKVDSRYCSPSGAEIFPLTVPSAVKELNCCKCKLILCPNICQAEKGADMCPKKLNSKVNLLSDKA